MSSRREAATDPLFGTYLDVPGQTLAVEPGLAAVDVAHVEEAAEGGIFRGAVVGGHEDVMLGRDGNGDSVVECGGRGISAPVHGVDADVGACNKGQHVLHVLHRVVADGDARVGLALGWTDVAACGHVGLGHLVAQYVGSGQLAVGLVVDMLQQFHHGQTALAEACDDKWTALVTLRLEKVESRADIVHRQSGALIDGILAVRHERLDGRMAIEGCEEPVTGRHIGRHLLHFQVGHVGAVLGVPHR